MKTLSHLWQFLAELLSEWKTFPIKIADKIKTHILCSITFYRKSCRVWDNVEICCGARETKNDDTIWRIRVACWIIKVTRIYALAQRHTHEHANRQIRNNSYCFHMATMVTRTRLNVTLYVHVHRLSCFSTRAIYTSQKTRAGRTPIVSSRRITVSVRNLFCAVRYEGLSLHLRVTGCLHTASGPWENKLQTISMEQSASLQANSHTSRQLVFRVLQNARFRYCFYKKPSLNLKPAGITPWQKSSLLPLHFKKYSYILASSTTIYLLRIQ
jgi:hypothetical protein